MASVPEDTQRCFEHGAQERQALAVRYRSLSGRIAERRFDPYITYMAEGALYAYGMDHSRGGPRVLALDRVIAVQPTTATFERPPGFSAEGFLGDLHRGFRGGKQVSVVLHLRDRAARLWTDRPELAGQKVEPIGQGAIRVRFRAADTPALRARLLSFGPELIVEKPTALRSAIACMLREAAEAYGSNAGRQAAVWPTQTEASRYKRKPLRRADIKKSNRQKKTQRV
jgi:predicted DNA-binding transcriptional regulator YafY